MIQQIIDLSEKMTISENDIVAFIKDKDIKLVGDRLITVPKKKEKGFFHVEMDVPEEEIDELLSDACCVSTGHDTSRTEEI